MKFLSAAAASLAIVGIAGEAAARNIPMHSTSLSNTNGRAKSMMKLERGKRYMVRVTNSTHFGTWPATRRALKNDACFEFNSGRGRVSLPVVKNSHGLNFCRRGYNAGHRYESQVIYGDGRFLSMWVYDNDYRDNYGNYYVQVILVQ